MVQMQQPDTADLKEQLRHFVMQNLVLDPGASLPTDDASFLDEGIIDSTGVLELVGFVQDTFGITVEDEDLVPDNLDSLNRLAGYVQRKLAHS